MALITDPGMIGYGTTVEVNTTGTTWFKIGLLASATPPNETVDQVDVTHMESPDRTRQFIAGLRDLGDVTLSINYVPGNLTDEYVLEWRSSGETRPVRITYPTDVIDTFPAFPTGYTPTLAAADKASADLKLKVAGAVVRT